MNKYKELEKKLKEISMHIDKMHIKNEYVFRHLIKYKGYIDRLIYAIHNEKINDSHGAGLGLIQGISDYDEICSDEKLLELVADADQYYANECIIFDDK
jgi:hypothetical protein